MVPEGLLLSTRGRVIVEESRRDAFWGAVPDKEEQAILLGRNIVGRLLMLLRDRLVDHDAEAMYAVPPLMLENFLLYGDLIGTVRQ